jgi:serine/threonine-protein kinase HipA
MSLGGKRDAFTLNDLVEGGKVAGLSARKVKAVLAEVTEAVAQWTTVATDVAVKPEHVADVASHLRLDIA